MARKLTRKNLKPPGKCIFCLGGAVPGNPMTGEHLWSDWMDKAGLLPRGGQYVEFKYTFKPSRKTTTNKFERIRQGSANTKKIKSICQICNSGWMGSLETDVRPFLTPLIIGNSIILNSQMCRTITEWIVMKVLVAEHNAYFGHPADPIFDQAARTAFMKSRTIPAGIRILISLQNGTKWVTAFHRHASSLGITTILPPPPPPTTGVKNVQTVTWGIGKLLIYLSAATDPNVYSRLELDGIGPLHRFWPLSAEDIVWPPRFFVTDAYIDDLSIALEELTSSDSVIRVGDAL
jgi:hypothetical protein